MRKKLLSTMMGAYMMVGCNCAHQPKQTIEEVVKQAFVTCQDGDYDYDTRCITGELGSIKKGVYPIKAENYTIEPDVMVNSGGGTGLLLPGGYVITAAHVIKDSSLDALGELRVEASINVFDNVYRPLEVIAMDEENDIAVLKTKSNYGLKVFDGELGDSSELEQGHLIYIIGNSFGFGLNMKSGMVSNEDFDGLVGVSAGCNPGDSGGPAFAVRDGQFEYVGFVKGSIEGSNDLTYIVPINSFK